MTDSIRDRPILTGGERLRQRVEIARGGGEKSHPRSFDEARRLLLPQAAVLRERVERLPDFLRGDRVIVEAQLSPNYLASSDFPERLFEAADLVPVGTRQSREPYVTRTRSIPDAVTKTVFLAAHDESIASIAQLLQDGPDQRSEVLWEDLRKFSALRLPGAEDVIRSPLNEEETGELLTWEVVLHRGVPTIGGRWQEADEEVTEKLLALVHQLRGDVVLALRRSVGGLTFVPAVLTTTAVRALAAFNPLRAVRRMPRLRPIRVGGLRASANQPVVSPPAATGPLTDATVACFDGGVEPDCPFVKPFVIQTDLTPAPADRDSVEHGSLVTNAILYGYPEVGRPLRDPELRVDHFRIWPPPPSEIHDLDLYWVLGEIETRVRAGGYEMAILCVAPDSPVEDGREPHVWTSTLDQLAAETGTLFIVAAGNGGEADRALQLHRVQAPADMANGIGIGSCTSRDLAIPLTRASYSSFGPGRLGARVQPIGVSFGGSAGEPFVGIGPLGARIEGEGTSYAAPLAAHGLGGLRVRLGRDHGSVNTVRAAAAHFADRRRRGHRVVELGYGRLRERYEDALTCPPNRVTVLYEDEINRSEIVTLRIPMPTGLDPEMPVDLRGTLSFVSDVDPADAVDYTLAGLELTFRPHQRKFTFRDPATGDSQELDEDLDAVRIAALLDQGYRQSQRPLSDTLNRFANEQTLRDAGKWETLLQFTRRKEAADLSDPELELAYYARASGQLQRGGNVPALRYALWVTISVPDGIDLYQLVQQQYPVLTPLTVPIRLRT
jgi:hypothetical protein